MANSGHCCVIGCNNYKKINENVKFYSFPDKLKEPERRQLWIDAINRKNEDGRLWAPTTDDKICNRHFTNGQKTDNKSERGYVPTIFPMETEPIQVKHIENDHPYAAVKQTESTQYELFCEKRFERIQKHKVTNKRIKSERNWNVCMIGMNGQMFKLPSQNQSESNLETASLKFHGIDSLENEQDLRHFTGASPATFKHFLSLLDETNQQLSTFLSQNNVLLLFLMKMKIGMRFNVLSDFFNVHRTTISRIFANVLTILTKQTQNSLVWPEIGSIKLSLPEIMRGNYPDTRVIVDIIEIETEFHTNNIGRKINDKYTFKFVLALNPNGVVCFKSKCYNGTISDKELVLNSEIFQLFEPNETVIFNRNIPNIRENLRNDVCIVEPPFNPNFKAYIDQLIRRFHYYNILKPIPTNLFRYIDNIVHMICILVNFQIPEDRANK